MTDTDYIYLVNENIRQKKIYQKALDLINMYGNLIDMQATAREALTRACDQSVKADEKFTTEINALDKIILGRINEIKHKHNPAA